MHRVILIRFDTSLCLNCQNSDEYYNYQEYSLICNMQTYDDLLGTMYLQFPTHVQAPVPHVVDKVRVTTSTVVFRRAVLVITTFLAHAVIQVTV
jgi:hypothetical protein